MKEWEPESLPMMSPNLHAVDCFIDIARRSSVHDVQDRFFRAAGGDAISNVAAVGRRPKIINGTVVAPADLLRIGKELLLAGCGVRDCLLTDHAIPHVQPGDRLCAQRLQVKMALSRNLNK